MPDKDKSDAETTSKKETKNRTTTNKQTTKKSYSHFSDKRLQAWPVWSHWRVREHKRSQLQIHRLHRQTHRHIQANTEREREGTLVKRPEFAVVTDKETHKQIQINNNNHKLVQAQSPSQPQWPYVQSSAAPLPGTWHSLPASARPLAPFATCPVKW